MLARRGRALPLRQERPFVLSPAHDAVLRSLSPCVSHRGPNASNLTSGLRPDLLFGQPVICQDF